MANSAHSTTAPKTQGAAKTGKTYNQVRRDAVTGKLHLFSAEYDWNVGPVSETAIALIKAHQDAALFLMSSLRADDFFGDEGASAVTLARFDAESAAAIRLAGFHARAKSTADEFMIQEYARDCESDDLRNLLHLPGEMIQMLVRGHGAENDLDALISKFDLIEAEMDQAMKSLDEAYARTDTPSTDADFLRCEAAHGEILGRLAAAGEAIRVHKCATPAEAISVLTFAGRSAEFQRELFDFEGTETALIKSLLAFSAPPEGPATKTEVASDTAPGVHWHDPKDSEPVSTIGNLQSPPAEIAPLIDAHRKAQAQCDELASGPDDAFEAARKVEQAAALALMAKVLDASTGTYQERLWEDYHRVAEDSGRDGSLSYLTVMPLEMVKTLAANYRP